MPWDGCVCVARVVSDCVVFRYIYELTAVGRGCGSYCRLENTVIQVVCCGVYASIRVGVFLCEFVCFVGAFLLCFCFSR